MRAAVTTLKGALRAVVHRARAAVFDDRGGVDRALGQDAQHGAALGFHGREAQHLDGVLAEEAPAVHAVTALELGEALVGSPVEPALDVLAFALEVALALQTLLRSVDREVVRRDLHVLLKAIGVFALQLFRGQLFGRRDLVLGHQLLHDVLQIAELVRALFRDIVVDVRDETFVGLQRREVQVLLARQLGDGFEALAEQRERRHDAVQLEVLVVRGALPVEIFGQLAPRQREVRRAIAVGQRLVVLGHAVREQIRRPWLAEIEHDVAVQGRGRRIHLARGLAVLPERNRHLHRRARRRLGLHGLSRRYWRGLRLILGLVVVATELAPGREPEQENPTHPTLRALHSPLDHWAEPAFMQVWEPSGPQALRR
jgi:hypothetical protein